MRKMLKKQKNLCQVFYGIWHRKKHENIRACLFFIIIFFYCYFRFKWCKDLTLKQKNIIKLNFQFSSIHSDIKVKMFTMCTVINSHLSFFNMNTFNPNDWDKILIRWRISFISLFHPFSKWSSLLIITWEEWTW
jgi:hypothetical protein